MPIKKVSCKACKTCKCKQCKCKKASAFDGFLSDVTANKLTVFVLMAAVLGLGAMFSMMLGVSAAVLK